jgi:hypothetical protein
MRRTFHWRNHVLKRPHQQDPFPLISVQVNNYSGTRLITTLETIRKLIGCPDPAGHALFERSTLEFRILPHHTAQ